MFEEREIRVFCVNGHEATFTPLEEFISAEPMLCCACRGNLVGMEENLGRSIDKRPVVIAPDAFKEYARKKHEGIVSPKTIEYFGFCGAGHNFQLRCPESLEELLCITICPVCGDGLASLEEVNQNPGEAKTALSLSAVIKHMKAKV